METPKHWPARVELLTPTRLAPGVRTEQPPMNNTLLVEALNSIAISLAKINEVQGLQMEILKGQEERLRVLEDKHYGEFQTPLEPC